MSSSRSNLISLVRAAVVVGALVGALAAPGATVQASSRDHDRDGLTNWFERYRSHTNPWRRDSDHDGIRDGSENPTTTG
jgi:hypothetical protein